MENPKAAIISFDEAIKIRPDKYEYYLFKAIAYQAQEKQEEAQATLQAIPPEVLATFMENPDIKQLFE